jgi:hypothetical protein
LHPYIIEQLAAEHRQELLRAARRYHLAAHARTLTTRNRRWRALADKFARALRIIGNPRPHVSRRSQGEPLTIPMLIDLTCCPEPILPATTGAPPGSSSIATVTAEPNNPKAITRANRR